MKFAITNLIFIAIVLQKAECFVSNIPTFTHGSTVLNPHHFAGYDAGVAGTVTWSPSEAAEFVVWHKGKAKNAGMQLSPMIRNWSGDDVGEFLSRLFLGEVLEDENRVTFCPSNVRNPQWLGLGDEGFEAMKDLLLHALPDSVLSPEGLSRCAQAFLMKEHRWPAKDKNADGSGVQFESDTFADMGHSAKFARVLGSVRRERMSEFTAKDIVSMLTLPEHGDKAQGYAHMPEFFNNLGVQLTSSEKVATVEQLALSGWAPSTLAKFVCSIEEIEEVIAYPYLPPSQPTIAATTVDVNKSEQSQPISALSETNGDAVPATVVSEIVPEIAKVPASS